MPEDFYAALMMRRALPTTTNIKTITAPGIYPVDAGNANAPVTTAGLLIVLPPTTRPTIKFLAADWNVYTLTAGNWQGLGTAAVKDIQTSKDDITAGRLLVNGGALALRTVLAGAGRPLNDFNGLPANSVSFGYDNATNTPGFTGSVLDYAGSSGNYRVQLAAQYNGNGNRIAFRTRNGDAAGAWNPWGELYHTRNKPTASDVDAVSATNGGTFQKEVGFNGGLWVRSKTGMYSGDDAAGYTSNNMLLKSWYGIGFYCTLTDANKKETGLTGYINTRTGRLEMKEQIIPGSYTNFDARYYTKTLANSTFQPKGNYTPAGQAYTKAESDARYGIVSGIRRGGQQVRNPTDAWFGNWESPAGCVVTGINMENRSDGRKLGVYYRQMQYLNKQTGAWVNVGD